MASLWGGWSDPLIASLYFLLLQHVFVFHSTPVDQWPKEKSVKTRCLSPNGFTCLLVACLDNNGVCADGAWGAPVIVLYTVLELRQQGGKGHGPHIKTSKHCIVHQRWRSPRSTITSPPFHHSHPLAPLCLALVLHPLTPRQTWPEPCRVSLLTLDRITAHESGSFMYFSSLAQRWRVCPFSSRIHLIIVFLSEVNRQSCGL